jgi:hypothetical protein
MVRRACNRTPRSSVVIGTRISRLVNGAPLVLYVQVDSDCGHNQVPNAFVVVLCLEMSRLRSKHELWYVGYWAEGEFSEHVLECAPPQLTRCRGWDTSRGAAVCGPCYLQASRRCSRCTNSCYNNFAACYSCSFRASFPSPVAAIFMFTPIVAIVVGGWSVGLAVISFARFRFGKQGWGPFSSAFEYGVSTCVISMY